jgi:hypothetical protein
MARFIFKLKDREVEFDNLPEGPVKEAFDSLQATFSKPLHDFKCSVHHQEPIVVLASDGQKTTFQGFCTCCEEFGSIVAARIPEPYTGGPMTLTTRVMKYTKVGS